MLKSYIPALTRLLLATRLAFVPFYANAERGFWRLEQVPTDAKILDAARSIFQITVPAGESIKVDLKQFPTVSLAMQSLNDNAILNSGERLLRERSFANCFDQKKDVCTLPSSFVLGSAFLVGKKTALVSAFHIFRDLLKTHSRKALPMIIQDRTGKIIFGSDASETADVAFAHPSALQSSDKTSPIVDAIELKLSKSLLGFDPLVLGDDTTLKVGDFVFNIGYPGPTNDRRKVHSKPDSDGISQLATYGKIIDYDEYFRRTGKDIAKIRADLVSLIKATTFYSDSDSYFGMSGAPSLNSKGEVIGMVIGSFPVDGSANAQKAVCTIKTSWVLNLRNLR